MGLGTLGVSITTLVKVLKSEVIQPPAPRPPHQDGESSQMEHLIIVISLSFDNINSIVRDHHS